MVRVKEEVLDVSGEDEVPSVWPGEHHAPIVAPAIKQELPDVCIKVCGLHISFLMKWS